MDVSQGDYSQKNSHEVTYYNPEPEFVNMNILVKFH